MIAQLGSQRVTAQFVPLRVNCDTPDGHGWTDRFPFEGKELPAVYVIRADGTKMYGRSGTPDNLRRFLIDQYRQGGRVLDRVQLVRMSRAMDEAARYYLDDDVAGAVETLAEHVDSGSFAVAAKQVDALAAQLSLRGRKEIVAAESRLSKDSLANAAEFVRVTQKYARLPGLRKLITETCAKANDNTQVRLLIDQATKLVKAEQFEQQEKYEQATQIYRDVEVSFPDTEAALIAADRGKVAAACAEKQAQQRGRNRAAALIQFAKNSNDPQKARAYLLEAQKLVPAASALGREAAELLTELQP